ncbi:hypothetical protein N9N67_10330, partial [Bacteriovoracaceae bacterium]|nr:hypothetical protein [Bacteriovoracaceae bacterium]
RDSIHWDVPYEIESLNPQTKFLYFPYFLEKKLVGALVFGYAQAIPQEEKVKLEALFLTTRCFFC